MNGMANGVSSRACSTTIIVGVYAIIFGLGKLCELVGKSNHEHG